jgi:hypothetical protein
MVAVVGGGEPVSVIVPTRELFSPDRYVAI